jgi:hypothetical protein
MLCERQAAKLTDFAFNLSRNSGQTCRDIMQTVPGVGLIFD